ncbi:MAG: chemotaxis protein CheW [Byssovorax sp.]
MSSSSNDERWSDEDRAILEARTRSLAAHPEQRDEGAGVEVLVLRVGGERYTLPSDAVRAVAALARLSPLPHAPPSVAGLTARGGVILPVFHLRAVLGLALTALPEYGRIVLLGEGSGQLALIVDAVEGTSRVDVAALRPAPPTLTAVAGALIRGVDGDGVPLLDPEALLASDRLFIDIAPPMS